MDRTITKTHTGILQGLAVLMMLFHHFFNKPANLTLIHFFNDNLCMRLAWLCKLCVVIFTFLSGYGMNTGFYTEFKTRSFTREIFFFLYKKAFIRIIRLYSLMWLIILTVKGSEWIITRTIPAFPELAGNILGIIYTYNGAWWYVQFYAVLCLLFPLLRFILSDNHAAIKKAALILLISVFFLFLWKISARVLYPHLAVILLNLIVALHPEILLSYVLGLLINEFSVFDRLNRFIIPISKNIRLILAFAVILLISAIRIYLAPSAAYCTWDFIKAPFLIFALVTVFNAQKKNSLIIKLFLFFSKYSTALWLTHVMLYVYSFELVSRYTKFVLPFFAAETVISLTISVPLTLIHNAICRSASGPKS